MGRIGRRVSLAGFLCVLLACMVAPLACTKEHAPPAPDKPTSPIVRVRLLVSQTSVALRATTPPMVKTASATSPLLLNVAPGSDATLVLTVDGWEIGGVKVPGRGELTILPAQDASVSINDKPYRGSYRFIPAGVTNFDVVNDVDVDGYLKSVLPRELLRGWSEETYRAQAITARTYALYEARTKGAGRAWDVYPDQRSQVYGGYADETSKSRVASDDTAGIVLVYPHNGRDRIFKTYFSACCGGVTQSAGDAFNEPYIAPLTDQNSQGLCSAAPRFSWGPVEISKIEMTGRLRAWGAKRGLADMGAVARVEILNVNRYNRPTRFIVIDQNESRYSLSAEEMRNAINSGATTDSPARVYSSFFKTINEPGSDCIKLVEGRGHGHGVGLCQYCSQARAEAGMRHEDIVLSAFPQARLVRAY